MPKILIVDDEPHILLLLEQTLEKLENRGVEILLAADGETGLRLIREKRPGIVFLDVMMPGMNGFDVCHAVKDDENTRDIFIVLLTAKGQELYRRHGAQAGADLYLTKPFDPDKILSTAARVLGLAEN